MSKIAVFDSGLGGLTVLSELARLLPGEDYIYYGDSAHAPFGDRSDGELLELCTDICGRILALGPVDCFAVACNTTTTRVLDKLKERFPDETFIGIAPAVAEAAGEEPGADILVLATRATAESSFLRNEVDRYAGAASFSILAAPLIVPFVEGKGMKEDDFKEYLRELLLNYKDTTDAVVLGCTHFPFVKDELRECFTKDVRFYDGAAKLSLKVRDFLYKGGPGIDGRGTISFLNSDPAMTEREKELFYEYQSTKGNH